MAKRRCLKRAPGKKGRCMKWSKTKSTAGKRRCLKRSGGRKGRCIKWAGSKKSTSRKGKSAPKCISPPGAFRMKTKSGYKCACVVRSKNGRMTPRFLPHGRCGAKGTRAMSYSSAKGMVSRSARAPYPKARW